MIPIHSNPNHHIQYIPSFSQIPLHSNKNILMFFLRCRHAYKILRWRSAKEEVGFIYWVMQWVWSVGIKQSIIKIMPQEYHRALGLASREVSLQAFEKFVLNSAANRQELFRSIREADSQGLPRFNIWRMLLDLIPIGGGWEDKQAALAASRKRWAQVRQEARSGVKGPLLKESPKPKNPLMKGIVKPEKKETDSDPFLLQEIRKDVERTYQQMDFFQETAILKLLTSVLFVWCKLNPDTSYKQGMNELLASVVYVYFQEAIPSDFEPSKDTEQRFLQLNSLQYAEADIFAVFERVMTIQKDMFKESLEGKVRGEVNPNSKNNSPILQRINQLQDHRLKALDLELFRILKLQDVRTKTFLLRWIRCLHTREFGLINSLPIWDCILLDAYESPNSRTRNQFQFVDAMCLAMFIYMRTLVFTRQTANEIQQIYQKYPELQGNDLKQLLALAWSVNEELRNSHAPTPNANWYEDSAKSKDLGLMDKGRDTIYRSKLVQRKDKDKGEFEDEDSLYPDLDRPEPVQPTKKEPSPINNYPSLQKPHQKFQPKPENTQLHKQESVGKQQIKQEVKQQLQTPSPVKIRREIVFLEEEIKSMVANLKRSIALNEQILPLLSDIQSRSLANQALRALEDRLRMP